MTTTQIELRTSPEQKEVVTHVLPCHIAHDGPAKVAAHFKPRVDSDDASLSTATFRGRKLRGRKVVLPENYRGILTLMRLLIEGFVLQPVDPLVDTGHGDYGAVEDDEEDDEEGVKKVTWESTEAFDGLTVWEHHGLPDEKQDHWIRAVQEWVVMANAVCGYSSAGAD
jgi:ribonuclease H2 subunit C